MISKTILRYFYEIEKLKSYYNKRIIDIQQLNGCSKYAHEDELEALKMILENIEKITSIEFIIGYKDTDNVMK